MLEILDCHSNQLTTIQDAVCCLNGSEPIFLKKNLENILFFLYLGSGGWEVSRGSNDGTIDLISGLAVEGRGNVLNKIPFAMALKNN